MSHVELEPNPSIGRVKVHTEIMDFIQKYENDPSVQADDIWQSMLDVASDIVALSIKVGLIPSPANRGIPKETLCKVVGEAFGDTLQLKINNYKEKL